MTGEEGVAAHVVRGELRGLAVPGVNEGEPSEPGLPQGLLAERAQRASARAADLAELRRRLEAGRVRETSGGEGRVGELEEEPWAHLEQTVALREREALGRREAEK